MTAHAESHLLPGRLEERFADKHPLYSPGDAAAEAARCLYCFDSPCMRACPTHIDIATFIRKIASGNLRGSAKTILSANLLGASCAKVCPVEVLCEGACVYIPWGRRPISIGRLQRYAMEKGGSPDLLAKAPPSGRSVGLVGAGPASLACAGTLALLGHHAVLYEKDELPGGLNTTGVAPYKMNARGALEEVGFIRALGVEIRTGAEVGRDITGSELLRRHDAVFLGVGLGSDTPLRAPGADGPGVVGAVEWIRRMKLDPRASVKGVKRAAVIGGGNTALDAARELAHLGVGDVKLVYRRSEAEMPGYRHEWEAAKREGVVMVPNALVKEVVRGKAGGSEGEPSVVASSMTGPFCPGGLRGPAVPEDSADSDEPVGSVIPSGEVGHVVPTDPAAARSGRLEKLRLARAKDGKPTAAELAALPVDLVVVAIGQAKLSALARMFHGVAVDDSGCIVADPETGRTGNPRVFAGGDAANGGKEVVNAAAEGQSAARAIDAMLREATKPASRDGAHTR